MTPERMKNLRQKIAEAREAGMSSDHVVHFMPISIGELLDLLDKAETYDARTSELLAANSRFEQMYRDAKAAQKNKVDSA